MPSVTDSTLESQNDEELGGLHSKIRALRGVTMDILDDANRQNDQLDRTTNTFSSFTNSLFSTTRHHSRSMAASSTVRQYRTIAYMVLAIVALWIIWKMWPAGGSGKQTMPPLPEDVVLEARRWLGVQVGRESW